MSFILMDLDGRSCCEKGVGGNKEQEVGKVDGKLVILDDLDDECQLWMR